jgi:putative hydrolase of the HAD superfamily
MSRHEVSLEMDYSTKELKVLRSILQTKTWFGFDLDDTLHEFRKASGAAVLTTLSKISSVHQIPTEDLQAAYKKAGARSLLTYLKSVGKKVVIITEGPHDAQEWTLEKLGLLDQVDSLATTNFFSVSKVGGLFNKVLGELKFDAEDLVYVGDSWERDMLPARACGIYSVYYSERGSLGWMGMD